MIKNNLFLKTAFILLLSYFAFTIYGQNIYDFNPIANTSQNQTLKIPSTHNFQYLVSEGEYGTLDNYDFTAFVPIAGSSSNGYLSINHEIINGGVSVFDIEQDTDNKHWQISNIKPIQYGAIDRPCSGHVTSWGAVLSCEEDTEGEVLEIDPATGSSVFRYQLGRLAHENVAENKTNQRTFYTGEDTSNGVVLKFVADNPQDLSSGSLYALDLNSAETGGTWNMIDNFFDTDTHLEAVNVGAETYAGVEDIEISPIDGKIYFSVKGEGNIYRLTDNNPTSGGTFSNYEVYASGIPGVDNLAFDDAGNLWALQDGFQNHIWVIEVGHTNSNPTMSLFGQAPTNAEPTGITFTPDFNYLFMSVMHPNGNDSMNQPDVFGNTVSNNSDFAVVISRNENWLPATTLNVNNFDSNCTIENISGAVETSGITYSGSTNTLFSVSDNLDIYELDLDGNLIRTISLSGFNDTEGIVWLGGNQFGVTEERFREIVIVTINSGTTNINYPGSSGVIALTDVGAGDNFGFEGLAYDDANDILYIGKEGDQDNNNTGIEPRIYQINNPLSEVGNVISNPIEPFTNFPSCSNFDISGLTMSPTGSLLLISEQCNILYELNPNNGIILSQRSVPEFSNPEGVTMINDNEIWIVGENNQIKQFVIVGSTCDDGDPNTNNDAYTSNCGCEGFITDCPTAGQACDDGDPCTINDIFGIDISCPCIGTYSGDSDNDGVCNSLDLCPGFDDNLIGTNCDDSNGCTVNDVYTSDCECVGTPLPDSDNDGICDLLDACPDLNNGLIGSSCDDFNDCTINDMYASNCECVGTPLPDSDNDGICDDLDMCPNLDDSLIGTACNDFDDCTTDDLFTTDCDCVGTLLPDSDNDGICDDLDMCPNLDDSLIGTPCDDNNDCSTDDVYTSNCECLGIIQDTDDDGAPDGCDICPLLNDNLIGTACDDFDDCTINDVYNSDCACAGTFQDTDNDDFCDAEDQCPGFNDYLIGYICDDGNECTTNDIYTTDCNCAGTPLPDSDNDGVCDDFDLCPNFDDILIGSSCDDGNPLTVDDIITENCLCEGTLTESSACFQGDILGDIALETGTGQTITGFNENILGYEGNINFYLNALVFNTEDLGSDACVTQANVTFTSSEVRSGFLELNIYGELVPDAPSFGTTDYEISTRFAANPTISNTTWTVDDWDANQNYTTVDLSPIIQEIIDQDNFEAGNSIALFFEAVDQENSRWYFSTGVDVPELCIEFDTLDSDNDGTPDACDVCNDCDAEIIIDILSFDPCGTGQGSAIAEVISSCDDLSYAWIQGGPQGTTIGVGPEIDGLYSDVIYQLYLTFNNNVCGYYYGFVIDSEEGNCEEPCDETDFNDGEIGWGIWADGGADAARTNNASFANSGNYSFLIKDNTATSVITTSDLDLTGAVELIIDFNFIAKGFNASTQDFWLQVSDDGGASFTTQKTWTFNEDFVNLERSFEQVVLAGPFTANTQLRFRCDANANNDKIYIDDILIQSCSESTASCDDGIQNGDEIEVDCGGELCQPCSGCYVINEIDFEDGLGIWIDGGIDARRNSLDQAFADSGIYCIRLQDDSDESTFTTGDLEMSNYEVLEISFSYITSSMESGEGFLVQYSTDGGTTFTDFGNWELNTDFVNGVRAFAIVEVSDNFTANTQVRIMGNGNNNSDRVYIDNVVIQGCYSGDNTKISGANSLAMISVDKKTSETDQRSNDTGISVNVFPNPSSLSHDLFIESPQLKMINNIELIGIDGKSHHLTAEYISDSRVLLNTNNLKAGSYIIRLTFNDQIITKKILLME